MKHYLVALLGSAVFFGSSAAHAEWRKFQTAHFIIYSESDDKRVDELATGLEGTDGLMRMATGLPMDAAPVKVRIYEMADEGQVQAALGLSNSGIAGFYTSNILGPYAVTLRKDYSASGDFTAPIVLHHEYAHHFMMQYFPATYPPWYVEGFAELIGASKTLPDGRIAYGYPAKYRGDAIAVDWVDVRDVLLKPVEKLRFDLYGQGWAMTHYLTFSKDRAGQLRKYLEALNAGKSPQEAASAFGDLAKLNRDAHAYVSRGMFNYTPVNVPVRQPVIESVAPVSPAEAALIPETIAFNDDDLSLYRKAGDREREEARRKSVLEHIRTKAARFPDDPYALYLLAEAEDLNGNRDAAGSAADRLLRLQPQNVGGLALKSMLLSEDAKAAASGELRAKDAEQARILAVAANKADRDSPLAYVAFYESYREAGEAAPRDAVIGLEAAVEKLPNNTGIRQLLVDELASERHWRLAMAVLAPLANDPHESPLRQAAREQMARLQTNAAGEKPTL